MCVNRKKRLVNIFFRQELAFQFADTQSNQSKVFSFEKEGNAQGGRKFVVATYEEFWDVYRHLYAPPCPLNFRA